MANGIAPKPDERLLTEEEREESVLGIPACGENLALNLLQHKHATDRIAKAQLAKCDAYWRQILRDTIVMKDAECQARLAGIFKEIEDKGLFKNPDHILLSGDEWQALKKQEG